MIKLIDLLEIKVVKPSRTWDFSQGAKYIPNFNPNHIKVGDKIKKNYFLLDVGKILKTNDGVYYYIDIEQTKSKNGWDPSNLTIDELLDDETYTNEATTYLYSDSLQYYNLLNKPQQQNEIKVVPSKKQYDLSHGAKYIPNFNPKNIRKGDIVDNGYIRFTVFNNDFQKKLIINKFIDDNGDEHIEGWTYNHLIQTNNKNKPESLNEISSRIYTKLVSATPKQKTRNAHSLIRKKLQEIDKILDLNERLREELGKDWKLSEKQLSFVKDKMNSLSQKLKKLTK